MHLGQYNFTIASPGTSDRPKCEDLKINTHYKSNDYLLEVLLGFHSRLVNSVRSHPVDIFQSINDSRVHCTYVNFEMIFLYTICANPLLVRIYLAWISPYNISAACSTKSL